VKSPPDAERTYIADMSGSGGDRAVNSAVLGFLLAVSGCASPAIRTTALPADGPTTTSSQPASKPQDLTAPSTYQPILRNGQRPHPTVKAPVGGFSASTPAKYPDGLRIKVLRVSQGVEKGRGPGVFPGRTHTALAISLTNGSPHAIDLNQVVVTAIYGTPARIAQPVYKAAPVRDFAGTVKTGQSASAMYAFAIPANQVRKVVVMVDVDGVHAAAKFAGAIG
jgi:hypothetical protein